MIVKSISLFNESYTHKGWAFHDINVGFSRLYYILAGEAYYVEGGVRRQLLPGHLYLTPVRTPFDLYDNPENQLLHTYAHVTTAPAVKKLVEIKVEKDTPLADAVALWRRYVTGEDAELVTALVQLILSLVERHVTETGTAAARAKAYLDSMEGFLLDMTVMSRAVGYTREHITRAFKEIYQRTPHQYLHQRRMSVARARLLAGKSVAEAAAFVGYANVYSFSKAFLQYFGLSPAAT